MSTPTSTQELAVPKQMREVVGAMMLASFLLFFVSLAVYNLLNCAAIIPSILWLLLVGAVLAGFSREKGARPFAIEILGAFSLKHFVRTIHRETGGTEIQFGYRMFGRCHLYLTIPVEKIEHINWSTGQATHMARRDMNDWSIAIWYEHGDPIKSQKQKGSLNPDQDVYIVGTPGRKENVAAFGHALLVFLRGSGASLVPGNNECTFVRQPA